MCRTCHKCTGCGKLCEQPPQLLCEPGYRRCHRNSPCDPFTRPCSPCRPCCKLTKAPNPIPPYGPQNPRDPCGSCVEIDKHDIWSKKWN